MKNAIILLFSLITLSCNNKGQQIEKETISKLSQGDFSIPSVHGFLYLFFSVEGDKKGQGNINILHDIYIRYYKNTYKNFSLFLSDALNQKIIFKEKECDDHDISYFKLNHIVEKHYHELSLMNFIKYYCDKDDKSNFFVKRKYNNDKYLMTILFYLFLNNYEITSDDYIGKYQARKV
jgi:hypothetical protein